MTDVVIVQTTTSSFEQASSMQQILVKEKLAACVQIEGPITSHYFWEGTFETSHEFRLSIKTLKHKLFDVEQFVLQHHPYSTPEFFVTPVLYCEPKYYTWLVQAIQ